MYFGGEKVNSEGTNFWGQELLIIIDIFPDSVSIFKINVSVDDCVLFICLGHNFTPWTEIKTRINKGLENL